MKQKNMTQKILSLLREYKYVEAFWAAAENVMTDTDSQKLFLNIVMSKWQIVHLQDDIEKIRELADQGNPYMQCAFARLHDFLHLCEESIFYCQKYYTEAMENGISDAGACLGWLYGSGAFGEKDINTYQEMLETALDEQSQKAFQMRMKDIIYGNNGTEQDPNLACEMIKEYLSLPFTDSDEPNIGTLYSLLGDAKFAMGNRDEATKCYEKACELYQGTAYYDLALMTCMDDGMNIIDDDRFEELMEKAQDAGDPRGYLQYIYVLSDDIFDALDEERKKQVTKIVYDSLTIAVQLGEPLAAYILGDIYKEGKYGFEQDYAEAFSFFARGATMFESDCFLQISNMILVDHTAPEQYDEEFGYECAYRRMLFGGDTLDRVIDGYKKGHLTNHAAAIEKLYLPEYEKNHPQDEDDEPDDDNIDNIQTDNMSNDDGISLCEELTDKAELFSKKRDCPWKVTPLIKKYVELAERLKDNANFADRLYETNSRMIELICNHPRLNRQLQNIQLDILHIIGAMQERTSDIRQQTAEEIKETEAEIEFLTKCITLADKGRFNEIPQRGCLKRDPIEWTSRWEEVIDEADRKTYRRLAGLPRGMGWCFGFWHERSAALREFGIEWQSPSMMNPGVMFD